MYQSTVIVDHLHGFSSKKRSNPNSNLAGAVSEVGGHSDVVLNSADVLIGLRFT